ncbi:hypothetical protein [Azospirillum brasilense]|nr:hypothetical protein [Azospirillum brasilense]
MPPSSTMPMGVKRCGFSTSRQDWKVLSGERFQTSKTSWIILKALL